MDILNTIIAIIALLIGYYLGKGTISQPKELYQTIKRKLDTTPVGVIKRPTQVDLLKRTDPMEKKLAEGEDAMRETLKNIKELQ